MVIVTVWVRIARIGVGIGEEAVVGINKWVVGGRSSSPLCTIIVSLVFPSSILIG